jgi:chemotaxis signal transduction protein
MNSLDAEPSTSDLALDSDISLDGASDSEALRKAIEDTFGAAGLELLDNTSWPTAAPSVRGSALDELIAEIDTEQTWYPPVPEPEAERLPRRFTGRDTSRQVVVKLGGLTFTLPLSSVREVQRFSRPTPIPSLLGWSLGIVSLRGEIHCVIDPRRLLGMEQGLSPGGGYLLITRADDTRPSVALVFDDVKGVIGFTTVRPLSSDDACPKLSHIRGIAESNGQFMHVLDLDSLITSLSLA